MATAFRSSNPALNEKVFDQYRAGGAALEPGWAQGTGPAPAPPGAPTAPSGAMTVGGVSTATGVLLVLLVAAAVVGWNQVDHTADTVEIPGWLPIPLLVAFGLAILTVFKPLLARFTGPIYAVAEGLFLGAISALYNTTYDGIVVQAVALTIGVFAVMLFLYATGVIKVTEKLRFGIVAATGAIALVYLVNIVLSLFDAEVPFLHDTGAMGIGISLLIVGVAAFNLLLDFDFIDRGARAGVDRRMEWFAAFGLLLTLVWLYLELLRLLAKLQRR